VFQVRIHGRGGQGVVTAAELLSVAAFAEGRHSQAFPSFGSERMGAPVVSFCRIDDRPIRVREPIAAPDALIIQDPTLLHQVDLFAGLDREGYMLINSSRSFDELGLGEFVRGFHEERLLTVPATELAREHLGRPLPNAALLGGFAGLAGVVSIESVEGAIAERFTGALADRNVAAARAASDYVTRERRELARAATG
jgi:pyruvate ferredoxin oxidoreductase gamma subunit